MIDLSKDITSLIERIDSMPDSTRRQILEGLQAKAGERQANAMRVPLKTPVQAMAADSRNKTLLKQVVAQLARVGYDIGDGSERISMTKLHDCIRANAERMNVDAWGLKTNLAILNLIS